MCRHPTRKPSLQHSTEDSKDPFNLPLARPLYLVFARATPIGSVVDQKHIVYVRDGVGYGTGQGFTSDLVPPRQGGRLEGAGLGSQRRTVGRTGSSNNETFGQPFREAPSLVGPVWTASSSPTRDGRPALVTVSLSTYVPLFTSHLNPLLSGVGPPLFVVAK